MRDLTNLHSGSNNAKQGIRGARFLCALVALYFATAGVSPIFKSISAQPLFPTSGKYGLQRAIPQRINQRVVAPSTQPPAELPSGIKDPKSEESRIGAEDVLDVNVFEAPELNRTARVSENGEISLELLGTVRAAGLTPRELEIVLQELLRRTYMKDPHVGVFVRELQSHPISVVGAVKMPGVFQIRGSKSVLEMISMAQGLSEDAGETVMIMRGSGIVTPSGKAAASQELLNNKNVSLDQFSQTSTAKSALPPVAGKIVEINLKRLMESDDPASNVAVHSGDVVKVSRAGIVYVVGGGVKTPGGFVLKNNENISVLQAIALAQGLTRTSSKNRAVIIRTDQQTNQRTEIQVNLGKILASKAADPVLQPRDIVYVPDSTAKTVMYRGAEAALSTATGVAIYRW
jgi:polysaccharide export outer membrane protein